jgi:ligand-binding sensor domain-containing protein
LDGLAGNYISAIAIDAMGNKWFGSHGWYSEQCNCIRGGVSKFDDENWITYSSEGGLVSNYVNAIALDAEGNAWFGTGLYSYPDHRFLGGGLSKFDGTNWTNYTTDEGLVNNNVNSIAIDKEGNKWFACGALYWGGVSKFDGTNWTTIMESSPITTIAIDAQGNKWFGTDGGVSKFDGTTWTIYDTLDGLASNYVFDIAIDALGNKWFGTYGGVSKFDGINWTTYDTLDGLANNHVIAIAIDKEGNKWFGTDGGVSKFDGTTWTTYTTEDGLVSTYVQAIAIDSAGNIWFGTVNGVSKLSAEGTGISTIANRNHLNLYPNPVKAIGTFEFENYNNRKVYLEIFDFSGRLIGEKTSSDERIEFDFSNYSSGIYFYKLRNSENIIGAGKIVRE